MLRNYLSLFRLANSLSTVDAISRRSVAARGSRVITWIQTWFAPAVWWAMASK